MINSRAAKIFSRLRQHLLKTNVWLCLASVAAVGISGCAALPPSQFVGGSSTSGSEKKLIVIFVHGVLGNAESTWGDLKSDLKDTVSWPGQLRNENFRIDGKSVTPVVYVFSYKTDLISYSSNITEVAGQLDERLRGERIFDEHDQIYFVTHSMGGLVTQRLLVSLSNRGKSQDLSKIRAVFMIGTPAHGSRLANIASVFSFNPQFSNMETEDINVYLQTLNQDWSLMLSKLVAEGNPRPKLYCAHEASPTYLPWVVNRVNAQMYCDGQSLSVDKNHIQIVKPENQQDQPYPWVKRLLAEEAGTRRVPNARIVLMDSSVEENVYNRITFEKGSTNADDIIKILSPLSQTQDIAGLPNLLLHKEHVHAEWQRDNHIKNINPAVVIVHFSSFAKKNSGCHQNTHPTNDNRSNQPSYFINNNDDECFDPDAYERFKSFLRAFEDDKSKGIKFLVYSRFSLNNPENSFSKTKKEFEATPRFGKRIAWLSVPAGEPKVFEEPIFQRKFACVFQTLLLEEDPTPCTIPTDN